MGAKGWHENEGKVFQRNEWSLIERHTKSQNIFLEIVRKTKLVQVSNFWNFKCYNFIAMVLQHFSSSKCSTFNITDNLI